MSITELETVDSIANEETESKPVYFKLDSNVILTEHDAIELRELYKYTLTLSYIKKSEREQRAQEVVQSSQQRLERNNRELAISALELVNACTAHEIDTIFFLDKSARPLGFLFLRTWQETHPDKPFPNIKFINVGRESDDWDRKEVQSSLHELFHDAVDNKNVCIVDDHKDTGVTMVRAQKLFEQTFPAVKKLVFKYGLYKQPDWNIADYKSSIGVKDAVEDAEKNAYGYITEPINFEKDKQVYKGEEYEYMPEHKEQFLALRAQLSSLAKEIAKHAHQVPKDQVDISLDIPRISESRLNEWRIFGRDPDDMEKLRQ